MILGVSIRGAPIGPLPGLRPLQPLCGYVTSAFRRRMRENPARPARADRKRIAAGGSGTAPTDTVPI